MAQWRRLADKLGVGARVEWVGWTFSLRDQLPHYDWADVFAFTSLRDTSGTGLLEALAAGAPIVGLDHQGAADIMTDQCAIRVSPATPQAAIRGFTEAVQRLAEDRVLLARLSAGALQRATEFTWDRQWLATRKIYESSATVAASRSAAPIDATPAALVAEGGFQRVLAPS